MAKGILIPDQSLRSIEERRFPVIQDQHASANGEKQFEIVGDDKNRLPALFQHFKRLEKNELLGPREIDAGFIESEGRSIGGNRRSESEELSVCKREVIRM